MILKTWSTLPAEKNEKTKTDQLRELEIGPPRTRAHTSTGRPPAAHWPPTSRPPAAHRPPTGRPLAVHRLEIRFNLHPLINHPPSLLAVSDFNMISSWLSLATARTCALIYNRLLINIAGYVFFPMFDQGFQMRDFFRIYET